MNRQEKQRKRLPPLSREEPFPCWAWYLPIVLQVAANLRSLFQAGDVLSEALYLYDATLRLNVQKSGIFMAILFEVSCRKKTSVGKTSPSI
jgi:hypothetical protein